MHDAVFCAPPELVDDAPPEGVEETMPPLPDVSSSAWPPLAVCDTPGPPPLTVGLSESKDGKFGSSEHDMLSAGAETKSKGPAKERNRIFKACQG